MPSIQFYIQDKYCYPVKVIINNAIAGIGACIIHKNISWLAHIIVSPGFRNRGVGTFITEFLIRDSLSRNCDSINLIATEMGEMIYAKAGFVTDTEYLFYKNIVVSSSLVPHASIIPYKLSFKKYIEETDKLVTGEVRSMHLKYHLPDGFVYYHNNVAGGFYLPGFGEGLVIAENVTAGIELMKFRLLHKDHAVFPADNNFALQLMTDFGLSPFKTAKRMVYGENITWKPDCVFNRIGGKLG